MTDPIAFSLAALALLAAPGPTNTLLAVSGAAAGFWRSLHLVVAAVAGYLISTGALALVVGPLANSSRELDLVLRVACAVFLLYAAWRLWREGGASMFSDAPVKFRRVLTATSLNPKAIVFAYVIVPHLSDGAIAPAAPYLAALACLAAVVTAGWLAGGSMARAGAGGALSQGWARRAGALVLCLFAVLISGSAFSS